MEQDSTEILSKCHHFSFKEIFLESSPVMLLSSWSQVGWVKYKFTEDISWKFWEMKNMFTEFIAATEEWGVKKCLHVPEGFHGLDSHAWAHTVIWEGHKEASSGEKDPLNSLGPGRCGTNSISIIFKFIIQNNSLGTNSEIAIRWMPHNFINGKSTLVQVMACCHQATSHYLNQCWPKSLFPNSIPRPQWVNLLTSGVKLCIKDAANCALYNIFFNKYLYLFKGSMYNTHPKWNIYFESNCYRMFHCQWHSIWYTFTYRSEEKSTLIYMTV